MDGIKLLSLEGLLEMRINGKKFQLVEVLTENQFKKRHIPGAVNIPITSIEEEAGDRLDRETTVVVYCSGYACDASTRAARKLMEMGFSDVLDYKGGKRGWIMGGLGMEGEEEEGKSE